MGKIATDPDSLSEGSQGRAIGSGVPIIEADRLMDELANPLDPAPTRRDRPNSSHAKAMRFRDQFGISTLIPRLGGRTGSGDFSAQLLLSFIADACIQNRAKRGSLAGSKRAARRALSRRWQRNAGSTPLVASSKAH